MLPTPQRPPSLFRWALALFLALVVLFALMAVTSRDRQGASPVENVLSTLNYPLQVATSWVSEQVRGIGEGGMELWRLRSENQELRAGVTALPALSAEVAELRRENARLREELGIRPAVPYPVLAAEVIGRDPRAWFDTVVIDRGKRDGVRENLAVINHQGLVGKVQRVTQLTATVKLLVDRSFRVSAMDAITQDVGGLEGRGPEGVVVVFSHNREARVSAGDPVVTSGLGGLIPPRLYIGSVESVTIASQGLTRLATIRPAVTFHRLDLVQVVMTEPEGNVEAEVNP